MPKRMLIDALHPEEMRIVIADNQTIHEFDFASTSRQQVKGNIYLAKITRVEPSLQAAFVEYGGGKQGFLPFSEIHPDYYQIPMSDRAKLIEEVERELEQEWAEEEAELNALEATTPTNAEVAGADTSATDDTAELLEPIAQAEAFAVPTFDNAPEPIAEAAPALPSTSEPGVSDAAFETISADSPSQELSIESASDVSEPQTEPPQGGDAPAEGVETIMSEEDEASSKRKRRVPFFKRYRIQEVIKRGQVVLVQVIKEERGNKGVSITTYLSLAGRYCVLMPNSPRDGGVSRKISDITTRKRLKELMSELKLAKGMSVIIRTAGVDRARPEIRRDFDYLVKLWNQIREETLSSTAPALVYEESNLIKRAIRDHYTSDIDEVIVEGEAGFIEARDFMELLLPSHTPRVKQYDENMPLFYSFGIEDQLLSMYDPVVKLKSGGYIVINPTEALISIDVNSGRSTSERNIEETATKTNIEAAYEIARQLRLRDLAGLIVVDYIDMLESRNRRAIERATKDALRPDRAKIQLGRISPFGLLEMSRQRLRPSISEASTVPCTHCNGRGVIRSNESLALHVLRTLEKDASGGQFVELRVTVPQDLAVYMLNHKRHMLTDIEKRYGVTITIVVDLSLAGFEFNIEKIKRDRGARPDRENAGRERGDRERGPRRPRPPREDAVEAPLAAADEGNITEVADENADTGEPRRDRGRRRRGGRGRGRDRAPRALNAENENAPASEAAESAAVDAPTEAADSTPTNALSGDKPSRASRDRGRRGGRRSWKDTNDTASTETAVSQSAATPADVYELPQFTQRPAQEPRKPVDDVLAPKPVVVESSARPEGAPPRKGWWQKMIELD